jgi:hypothetical protein
MFNIHDCSFASQEKLSEFKKYLAYCIYLEKSKLKPDIGRFYKS